LKISATNYNQLRELKELYTQMTESITDKFVLKSLEKYGARLDTFINMDPELKDKEPGKRFIFFCNKEFNHRGEKSPQRMQG
jgi:hypothetical protein